MEYPGGKDEHFRQILLYYFRGGKSPSKAARSICKVYGEGVITVSAARKQFARFKKGDEGTPTEEDLNGTKNLEEHLNEADNQTTRQFHRKNEVMRL